MFKTNNDLPESTRTKVIDLLNARLADAIVASTNGFGLSKRICKRSDHYFNLRGYHVSTIRQQTQ